MIFINRNIVLTLSAILASVVISACSESTSQSEEINNAGSDTGAQTIDITGPNLKLSSDAIDVEVGSVFTLDVELNVFPITEGGGVNIGYSADVLQVKKVLINNNDWDFVNQEGSIDNVKGIVSNVLVSSYKGVENNSVLATVTFEAVAAGGSVITLTESTINPFSSSGTKVNPLFINSHVTVR